MAYSDSVLADNPRAYWKLDETGAGTVADSSGNNHPGSVGATGVTFGVAPLVPTGTAMTFAAASSARVSFDGPTSAGIVVANFTIEAWIRTTQSGASTPNICGADDGSSGRWFQFRVSTGGKLEFIVFSSAGAASTITGSKTINDGLTHHVVGAFGSDNNVNIYVDGNQDATTVVGPATHSTSITQFRIADRYTGSETNFFDGTIDEVALYPAALSAARITNHYQTGAGLIGTDYLNSLSHLNYYYG